MNSFFCQWVFRRIFMVGQQRQQISEVQFDKLSTPSSFLYWNIRFKSQVTTCSDFPLRLCYGSKKWRWSTQWMRKSSRSIAGKNFLNFEMLDAKIASALNKIIRNSHFKKKFSLEERKAQKENRFLRGRQISFMIYNYFESLVTQY